MYSISSIICFCVLQTICLYLSMYIDRDAKKVHIPSHVSAYVMYTHTYIRTKIESQRDSETERQRNRDSEIETEMNANEKYHHVSVLLCRFSVSFLHVSSSIKIILPVSVEVLL